MKIYDFFLKRIGTLNHEGVWCPRSSVLGAEHPKGWTPNRVRWTLRRREFFPAALASGLGVLGFFERAFGAAGSTRVRLGTLAPKGSSYYKHLQAMGEKWRQ